MVHNTHIKIYEPLKKKNNKIYCHLIAYNFVLLLSILFIHKFRRLRRNNKKRTEKTGMILLHFYNAYVVRLSR